eukprot:TRINITY_DN15870_c0_g1_i2.p1 TRINITY_DN15870_c0_g1~~TRINITY_DN15870_c0_g1_i2.p1  ORF type:complete len:424 (-),score=80.87 TRINITY_DN15870_c0_g1_i2:9-1280(-)
MNESGGEVGFIGVTCGNGHLDAGEECDDGNDQDNDGCTSYCHVEMFHFCNNATGTCKNCSRCPLGTSFESVPCGKYTDTLCIPCEICGSDSYTIATCGSTNDTDCAPCSSCSSSQVEVWTCSGFNDRICLSVSNWCEVGSYCNNMSGVDHCESLDGEQRRCVCLDGYRGSKVLSKLEIFGGCQAICGDGLKVNEEECDTGLNTNGCINCTIQKGWTCSENLAGRSFCGVQPECSVHDYSVVCEEWFNQNTIFALLSSFQPADANLACISAGYQKVATSGIYTHTYQGTTTGLLCVCSSNSGEPSSVIETFSNAGQGFPNNFMGLSLCQKFVGDINNENLPTLVMNIYQNLKASLPNLVYVDSNSTIFINTRLPTGGMELSCTDESSTIQMYNYAASLVPTFDSSSYQYNIVIVEGEKDTRWGC